MSDDIGPLLEALVWAESHNAVLRFNGNEEHEGRSIRCTVVGHRPEDRIMAVLPLPEDGDLPRVLTACVEEVRAELDATQQRQPLRLVACASNARGEEHG